MGLFYRVALGGIFLAFVGLAADPSFFENACAEQNEAGSESSADVSKREALKKPAAKPPEKTRPRKSVPTRFMDLSPEEIDGILKRARKLPFNERIGTLSALFLGTPYKQDPLGEGPEGLFDADPRFRLDAVDCLTYLETLLGMLGAENLVEAEERVQRIRYAGGESDYLNRLHFVWMQWLPYNEAAGNIRIVTRSVKGASIRRETKKLETASCCGGRWREFCERLGGSFPSGAVTHDIMDIDWALKNARRIPEGLFLFVVLENRPSLPYRISHSGLVVKGGRGGKLLRHASKVHGKVADVSLAGYLGMLKKKSVKWPVVGIILAEPRVAGMAQ